MKKLFAGLLVICAFLGGHVFAADERVLTGVVSEVYITDGVGAKVQCLILTLDEETVFDVYDDMAIRSM